MKKFAFLVHPRIEAKYDMRRVHPVFNLIPEFVQKNLIKYLPPILRGHVWYDTHFIGWIVVVPLTGPQMFSLDSHFVIEKIIKAIKLAAEKGAKIIGLGALTSPVTLGGKRIVNKIGEDITLTSGSAFTAAITIQGIKEAARLRGKKFEKLTLGILGATGSVGSLLSKLLSEEENNLILLARNWGKLQKLKNSLSRILRKGVLGLKLGRKVIRYL